MSSDKKELLKEIKCCLLSMLDTYEYWKGISTANLCENFNFWLDVEELCEQEWNGLKQQLVELLEEYFVFKSGFFWSLIGGCNLSYHWPGVIEISLTGVDKNTQDYHCFVKLFSDLDGYTSPKWEKDVDEWYYPFKHIYFRYNDFSSDTFEIHLLR